ncbi:DUF5329 family protein [Pontibacter sp. HSC-36F09]|uniref:DUF5329 family protein n=1 Tax=Pontibacter sp. HSC-36F09 TaxID=2910966 RepID=UPI00209C8C30|nr:DUF5329 family protein [Pontibacter sp. HSC-36F09]MCP2042317.1 hypothetical protein [Pontibacter sp. HSC-36F09]
MFRVLFVAVAILLFHSATQPAAAQASYEHSGSSETMSEDQKVQKLIEYIRTLQGATFIRDNSEFAPEKAAEHLYSKWKKHASKIKTAEGFVTELATQSSSGTPYSIRFADGSTNTTRDVLLCQLSTLVAQ